MQNFGSWSPFMVSESETCLGLEYFVQDGDDLWAMPDADLVGLATRELVQLGLVEADLVRAGHVVRMRDAYPVYDDGYQDSVATIRTWLEREVPNVHPVGRNGMHRYNNQDHSMVTALLAVENILDGAGHDCGPSMWKATTSKPHPTLLTAPGGLAITKEEPAARLRFCRDGLDQTGPNRSTRLRGGPRRGGRHVTVMTSEFTPIDVADPSSRSSLRIELAIWAVWTAVLAVVVRST